MLKRRLVTVAIAAGLMAPLVPLGAPAQASQCDSPIRLYSWVGAKVADDQTVGDRTVSGTVTNPYNLDTRFAGCTLEPEVDANTFLVIPGATFVTGRDDASLCTPVYGYIDGPDGFHDERLWTPPVDPIDGSCNAAVGTTGARTPRIPIIPTALGEYKATTSHGTVSYHTVDQI